MQRSQLRLFLFTFGDVAFKTFQIKVSDSQLHLEQGPADIAAVADGSHRVGAARRSPAIARLVLAQLRPQCVAFGVTDALVLVGAGAVSEDGVVAVLEAQLAVHGLEVLGELSRRHLPAIDRDALERQ